MKIECPNCKLTGNMEDERIPLEGANLDCPRCKTRFAVKREVTAEALPGHAVSTCPACQYSTFSEETFLQCPKCGTIPAEFTEKMKKRQEERAREEQRRREEQKVLDKYGDAPEEDMPAVAAEEVPLQVTVIGWLAVGVSVLFLVLGLKGFFAWSAMSPPPPDPYGVEPVVTSGDIFRSHGLVPLIELAFAIYTGAAALQFLKLRQWSRLGLEISGWTALAGVIVIHFVEIGSWIAKSSSFPFLVILTTLLGMVIWSVPPLAAVWFLRGEVVRKTVVG